MVIDKWEASLFQIVKYIFPLKTCQIDDKCNSKQVKITLEYKIFIKKNTGLILL